MWLQWRMLRIPWIGHKTNEMELLQEERLTTLMQNGWDVLHCDLLLRSLVVEWELRERKILVGQEHC